MKEKDIYSHKLLSFTNPNLALPLLYATVGTMCIFTFNITASKPVRLPSNFLGVIDSVEPGSPIQIPDACCGMQKFLKE